MIAVAVLLTTSHNNNEKINDNYREKVSASPLNIRIATAKKNTLQDRESVHKKVAS